MSTNSVSNMYYDIHEALDIEKDYRKARKKLKSALEEYDCFAKPDTTQKIHISTLIDTYVEMLGHMVTASLETSTSGKEVLEKIHALEYGISSMGINLHGRARATESLSAVSTELPAGSSVCNMRLYPVGRKLSVTHPDGACTLKHTLSKPKKKHWELEGEL